MFGPKLDARSYTTFLLMVIAVLLSISLFAQPTTSSRPNVASVGEVSGAGNAVAAATREVAAATKEVAASNREIASALRQVAAALAAQKGAAATPAADAAAPAAAPVVDADGAVEDAAGTARFATDPNAEPVVTTTTDPDDVTININ